MEGGNERRRGGTGQSVERHEWGLNERTREEREDCREWKRHERVEGGSERRVGRMASGRGMRVKGNGTKGREEKTGECTMHEWVWRQVTRGGDERTEE